MRICSFVSNMLNQDFDNSLSVVPPFHELFCLKNSPGYWKAPRKYWWVKLGALAAKNSSSTLLPVVRLVIAAFYKKYDLFIIWYIDNVFGGLKTNSDFKRRFFLFLTLPLKTIISQVHQQSTLIKDSRIELSLSE